MALKSNNVGIGVVRNHLSGTTLSLLLCTFTRLFPRLFWKAENEPRIKMLRQSLIGALGRVEWRCVSLVINGWRCRGTYKHKSVNIWPKITWCNWKIIVGHSCRVLMGLCPFLRGKVFRLLVCPPVGSDRVQWLIPFRIFSTCPKQPTFCTHTHTHTRNLKNNGIEACCPKVHILI